MRTAHNAQAHSGPLRSWRKRRYAAAAAATLTLVTGATSVAHAEPQGHVRTDIGVGYFYGTIGEAENVAVLTGGTAEEFCDADPDQPFDAEPGSAQGRLFFRTDGSLDIHVNSRQQPIHLYDTGPLDGPPWINQFCAAYFAGEPTPEPFATGTAHLKVRTSVISDDLIDVFNSINGTATAADGTHYKLRASADLIVENGAPVGDPSDFVTFSKREIKRGQ